MQRGRRPSSAARRRRRHPAVLAGVRACTPGTSSPAALLWMIYDLVVYASILFGPEHHRREPAAFPPSIFQIETELIFVIPASVLESWFLIDRFGRKPLQVWGFVAGGGGPGRLRRGCGRSSPASALLAFLVYGLLQHRPDRAGPGLRRRHLRRRAGADAHPQRGPVDHRGRRADRRGDQRLRLPARCNGQHRLRRHHVRGWRLCRCSAACSASCWCPRPARARSRRSTSNSCRPSRLRR